MAWPAWLIEFPVDLNRICLQPKQFDPRATYELSLVTQPLQESKGKGLRPTPKRSNFCPGLVLKDVYPTIERETHRW